MEDNNYTVGSGNVFADLELPNPEERLAKAELDYQANYLVKKRVCRNKLKLQPLAAEIEVAKICDFLDEMGGTFAYLGRQFRLEVDCKEYFIDILLYHRHLRCLVAVELKIGEFIPEFVGKMQFYLAALDSQAKIAGENPSIGIILCKNKSKMTVEYALRDSHKPIGVATYTIVKNLPKELKDQLPSAEQIAKLIGDIE